MSRHFKIKDHPQKSKIIMRLASGEKCSAIADDYPGLARQDLEYFKRVELAEVLASSPELKAEMEMSFGMSAREQICNLARKGYKIMDAAEAANDPNLQLRAMHEVRGCFADILKADSRTPDTQVNINTQVNILNSPEWLAIQTRIYNVLQRHPEALEDLRNEFKTLPTQAVYKLPV